MSEIIKYESLTDKLITIKEQLVLLDRDIANLYGVETKALNQAIKRNIDKFPSDYMFELSDEEFEILRSQNVTANLNKTRVNPKAFTEKGLYMVATILKSPRATEATFSIIETFASIKELSRNITTLTKTTDEEQQKHLTERTAEILDDIIDIEVDDAHSDGDVVETETRFELNLGVVKISKSTKRKKE